MTPCGRRVECRALLGALGISRHSRGSIFYVMIITGYSKFHRLRLRLNTRGGSSFAAVHRCKARRNWGRK